MTSDPVARLNTALSGRVISAGCSRWLGGLDLALWKITLAVLRSSSVIPIVYYKDPSRGGRTNG